MYLEQAAASYWHNIFTEYGYTAAFHVTRPASDLLLLEISPVFLINEDKVEVVARRELLVDVAEGWGEVKAAEEEADRYRFAAHGCAVHDFELGDGLAFVVLVGRWDIYRGIMLRQPGTRLSGACQLKIGARAATHARLSFPDG
jgi:hypothetical protein